MDTHPRARSSPTPFGSVAGSVYVFPPSKNFPAQYALTDCYETVRAWNTTLGPYYPQRARPADGAPEDRWSLDEVTVSMQGKQRNLWGDGDRDRALIHSLVPDRNDPNGGTRSFIKRRKDPMNVQLGSAATDEVPNGR